MARYKIIDEGNDFYTVKGVPIFQLHTNRGFDCNTDWMTGAIANHTKFKADDYRPTIILGHNKKNGVEKESVGYLDNLVLKGKRLYADLVRIPKEIKDKIVQNKYPSRSVEVLPKSKRILALALLGGTTPHFTLPQMTYENSIEKSSWYRSPIMAFSDDEKREISEIVGTAVGTSLAEHYNKEADASNGGAESGDQELKIIPIGNQEAREYFESGELPEIFETEDGKLYSSGKDEAEYYQWPSWVKDTLDANVNEHEQLVTETETGTDYQIDEETGEVYYDGNVVGQVVPTAPKSTDNVPVLPNSDPKLKVKPKAVGATGLETSVSTPTNPNVIPLAREESDQFASAESTELFGRLNRLETANALLQSGKRAEGLLQYLKQQKQSGLPVGNIEQTVDFLMSQDTQQIAKYKAMLESSPKVSLGRIKEDAPTTYDLDLTSDFEQHREDYDALGVSEKDLQYAKFVRVGPGVLKDAKVG